MVILQSVQGHFYVFDILALSRMSKNTSSSAVAETVRRVESAILGGGHFEAEF